MRPCQKSERQDWNMVLTPVALCLSSGLGLLSVLLSLPGRALEPALDIEAEIPAAAPSGDLAPLDLGVTPAPEPPLASPPSQPTIDLGLELPPETPPAARAPSSATFDGSPYLDTQDYQLGATTAQPYSAAGTEAGSERVGGCQGLLPSGKDLSASLCPPAPTTPRLAQAPVPETPWSWQGLPPSQPVASAGRGQQGWRPETQSSSRWFSQVAPRSFKGANPLRWVMPNGKDMLFPLSIPAPITSAFGWRLHPISGGWRFHSGIDLGAPMGTPVLAAFAGQVQVADWQGGYGLTVELKHLKGQYRTLYAHLSEVYVQSGQQVEQGTVIGLVGSTGNSTGPHLHFEVLQQTSEGLVAVDPGMQLEAALAQLVRALQTARLSSSPEGQS